MQRLQHVYKQSLVVYVQRQHKRMWSVYPETGLLT